MTVPDFACVASFCAKQAQGNRHIVIDPGGSAEFTKLEDAGKELSLTIANWIVVILACSGNLDVNMQARFFQNGKIIQRCGSGSIAAAFYLHQRTKNVCTIRFPLTLHTSSAAITIGKKQHDYFYQTKVLQITASSEKQLQTSLLNRPVEKLFLVGGNTDYCILVLRNKRALRDCQLNTRWYPLVSRRSVIVTSASCEAGVDYYLRYFNPRYGAYEDAATGSANAMLADYWQTTLNKKTVHGRQLSSERGEFTVTRRQGLKLQQQVYGQARFISEQDIGEQHHTQMKAAIAYAFKQK